MKLIGNKFTGNVIEHEKREFRAHFLSNYYKTTEVIKVAYCFSLILYSPSQILAPLTSSVLCLNQPSAWSSFLFLDYKISRTRHGIYMKLTPVIALDN